jgi:hypothetical protein
LNTGSVFIYSFAKAIRIHPCGLSDFNYSIVMLNFSAPHMTGRRHA